MANPRISKTSLIDSLRGQTIKVPNLKKRMFDDWPAGVNRDYKRMIPEVNRKLEGYVPMLTYEGFVLMMQFHIRSKKGCALQEGRLCPHEWNSMATSRMERVSCSDLFPHLGDHMG